MNSRQFNHFFRSAMLVSVCITNAMHANVAESKQVNEIDTLNAQRMQMIEAARPKQKQSFAPKHATPCVAGMADIYPCSNIDLMAFVPLSQFSANNTNSLWGWTDPSTEIEYALVGADNGMVFYDLSLPDHPRYLGKLNSYTGSSIWRDVRVYQNHAFIVSDNNGAHGMQVFDLTRLRAVGSVPQTFNEDVHYGNFGNGHTIAINEETGFAYVAGSNSCPAPTATGAVHMIDIRNPKQPLFAGCATAVGGYTHETQCWNYHGPDTAHVGKEICINSNGSSGRIAILDVTNKSAPVTLSSTPYAGSRYTHQGWLTDDHRYLLVNDELDETNNGHNARTLVWDVANLDAPILNGFYEHADPVIDHNLYIHGNYMYASNYESGLRILRLDNLSSSAPILTEVGFFDMYPAGQSAQFNGNWNNYKFPRSGLVIATGIDEGFFVLRPQLCAPASAPTNLQAVAGGNNQINLNWTGSNQVGAQFQIERAQGGCSGVFETVANQLNTTTWNDTNASGQTNYGYRVRETSNAGACASTTSTCVAAQTTGTCSAPPIFEGLSSALDAATAQCRIDLAWPSATPACGPSAQYSIYRDSTSNFLPSVSNLIASGISNNQYADYSPSSAGTNFYLVRAVDMSSSNAESNQRYVSARVSGPNVPGTFGAGAEPGDPNFDDGSSPTQAGAKKSLIAKHAGWHPATDRKRTGNFSFWSTRANNLCASLVSPNIPLQTGFVSSLNYWQAFTTQNGVDGGVVEVTNNDGQTWTRLTPSGGYPGNISGSETLCGIAPGQGAVTGTNSLAFAQSTIDLSAYAGQTIKLRWLYRSNATTPSTGGWYVDDISITNALVPGPCSLLPLELLFQDGFEN